MASADTDSTADGRISSGIAGLDWVLNGGLTPDRMYLVEGKPGTGKTTLALQFLLEGRKRGEACLYVTLSETTVELHGVAQSHDWSLDGIKVFQLEPAEGVRPDDQYTLYHPAEVELGETVKAVLEVVERLRPARVVFDSLSEMRLLARDPLRYRRQILALKDFFAGRACTVLLLDDHSADDSDMQLRSIAHGVILLEHLPFGYGRAGRRLRIVKIRGVEPVEGFHDFVIRKGGLTIYPESNGPYPESSGPRSDDAASSTPLLSGIPELDHLLGNGLSWGTTTLIIGPAGAGKSTLAAQFIAATALVTRAALYLFDEGRATFTARCDALGMHFAEQLRSGRIAITQMLSGELSAGEFGSRVRDAVESTGARVIFIDTLNGYSNAFRPHDPDLVRLHDLLSYLNGRGAATFITVAQHGVIGSGMETPIDISYLADCVILLRFFEAGGTVRRALSVVKKRTGRHESTIREFQIGPDRLYVGEALRQFEGVLTGVPRYTGESAPLLSHDNRR
jgi:circadian clock protein KaiC